MEKFCLKWNDFQTNASQSFSALRKEGHFSDVTLVSDDEKHIAAHKLVLSASSDFFKNILQKENHPNPLIYLTGIHSKHLFGVIEYIYEGEVQVFQNDIEDLLSIADKLKINGLSGNEDSKKEEKISENYGYTDDEDVASTDTDFDDSSIVSEFTDVITKTKQKSERKVSLVGASYTEAKQAVDELVMKEGDMWICKNCGKHAKYNTQIRKHAEIHIDGLSFPCPLCEHTFRSRTLLAKHRFQKH